MTLKYEHAGGDYREVTVISVTSILCKIVENIFYI